MGVSAINASFVQIQMIRESADSVPDKHPSACRLKVRREPGVDNERPPGSSASAAWGYIDNNAGSLVNYGARYRKGLPISSSIAESAVNQVVGHRMAKHQQMRWTDAGAHRLAQVRVADLNGELSVQRLAELAEMPVANSSLARQAA